MWFVFSRSALFSGKKTRKSILRFGRSKSQEINLENQYYKLASRWKKRGKKDSHFLLTEQVFFIN